MTVATFYSIFVEIGSCFTPYRLYFRHKMVFFKRKQASVSQSPKCKEQKQWTSRITFEMRGDVKMAERALW